MATRWTNRINPISWITRRRPREAVVAPGGRHEYSTPAEYIKTTQDDYSAADKPTSDSNLEWFAEEGGADSDIPLSFGTRTMNPGRPRTRVAGYRDGTLSIEFRDGAIYNYDGITPEQWQEVQRTQSTGKWMARNGIGGPGSGRRVN